MNTMLEHKSLQVKPSGAISNEKVRVAHKKRIYDKGWCSNRYQGLMFRRNLALLPLPKI